MTTERKHTELKLKLGYEANRPEIRLETADGSSSIGSVWGKNYKANAEFIVRAWNSYYDMLEALKQASEALTLTDLIDKTNTSRKAMEIVDEALSKAERTNNEQN